MGEKVSYDKLLASMKYGRERIAVTNIHGCVTMFRNGNDSWPLGILKGLKLQECALQAALVDETLRMHDVTYFLLSVN